MLLIGAGLMMRSLFKLQQVNPGYNPENVLAMRLSPNWSKYTTQQQYQDFFNRLLEKVKPQPGVLSASLASTYPMNPQSIAGRPFNRNFLIEGRPVAEGELAPRAEPRVASPEYFQTIQMPLVTGRYFTEADNSDALQVAIINQTMARHRWSDEDPVGKRVSFDAGRTWLTIVGIVGDVRQYGLDREVADEIYTPLSQTGFAGNLLVRTAADPMSMAQIMRETVYSIDPETAVDNVQTLEKVRSESLASPRLTAMLLGLFAGLALLITVTGISGVMALSVSQRTREIGIRMALGASQGKVLTMVMRQGMSLVIIGLAIGVGSALALTGVMSALLFSVEPHDPITFIAVSLVLMAVAAVACFVPARRVTTIDPMLALRSE
jgi:predicted permease